MKRNIAKQFRWWKYVAGTIPFSCLATLVITDWVIWSSLHNKVISVTLIGFFTAGVLWWWWAIDKIVFLSKKLISADEKFLELKKDIEHIKKDVKLLDDRN